MHSDEKSNFHVVEKIGSVYMKMAVAKGGRVVFSYPGGSAVTRTRGGAPKRCYTRYRGVRCEGASISAVIGPGRIIAA